MNGDKSEMVSEQVNELRERMRLLQGDRRANVELLETNKQSNKEEIGRLRDEIKQLRGRLRSVQRGGANMNRSENAWERERVKLLKQYDATRDQVGAKEEHLDRAQLALRELEMQSEHMQAGAEDSSSRRTIRMLENRLDKALIKYNEAQSIKKTYEQIVRRLGEERVGFDHQLGALERSFATKQRDNDELQLLSGDANHARDMAKSELERVRAGYEEERQRREKELRDRHQVVQFRKQAIDKIKARMQMRREIVNRAARGDDEEEYYDDENDDGRGGASCLASPYPNNAHRGSPMNAATKKEAQLSSEHVSKERLEQCTKIDVFEAAFRKIKDATGVSDVNQVIEKVASQESTTENLAALTKEHQQKIEALLQEKLKLKAHVEDIKYSSAGAHCGRKSVDDAEEKLADSSNRLERTRAKYERLAKMVIAAKAGVKHLQDKLETVREDVGAKRIEISDETLVKLMSENEKIMLELLARIRVANDDTIYIAQNEMAGKSQLSLIDETQSDSDLLRVRPYNQRIELPILDEFDADAPLSIAGHTNDVFLSADVDDELTRDKVKRASSHILMAQDKLKRKNNKHSPVKSPKSPNSKKFPHK